MSIIESIVHLGLSGADWWERTAAWFSPGANKTAAITGVTKLAEEFMAGRITGATTVNEGIKLLATTKMTGFIEKKLTDGGMPGFLAAIIGRSIGTATGYVTGLLTKGITEGLFGGNDKLSDAEEKLRAVGLKDGTKLTEQASGGLLDRLKEIVTGSADPSGPSSTPLSGGGRNRQANVP